jgi:hypothetical protein
MKKVLSILVAALVATTLASPAKALAADSANVKITISDSSKNLVVVDEEVTVTDVDNDGALTINDALYAAHEKFYEGGAEAGYASASTEWGLSLTKLWGEENGGSYGYYVNDAMAMSLGDTVKDNDRVKAYVYSDLTAWSDAYSYFEGNIEDDSDELELTLYAMGFDESFNPVANPVEGAVITFNGEETDYVTDANGKVTIDLADYEAGKYVISATSDSVNLVPPVHVVYRQVSPFEETPSLISPKPENLAETGASAVMFYVVGSLAAAGAAFAGKRRNEK